MVKKYESFAEFFAEAEQLPNYQEAEAALDFVAGLAALMRANGINNAELARRIGKSPAYVTKVLRADTNFTLRTMTMLSEAAGGTYHNRVCPAGFKPVWLQQTARPGRPATASLRNAGGQGTAQDHGGFDEAKSAAA